MTTDVISEIVTNVVQGTGPFLIADPYEDKSDIEVYVRASSSSDYTQIRLDLDYTVSPAASDTTGDVLLTASAAILYDGYELVVLRSSTIEQGYQAQSGPRDKGLEAQLNRTVRALQEIDRTQRRSILLPPGDVSAPLLIDLPTEGRALVARPDGKGWTNGPLAQTKDESDAAVASAKASANRAEAAAADIVARPATKAAADAAFNTYTLGTFIEVQNDETQGGGPYRYRVGATELEPQYAPATSDQFDEVSADVELRFFQAHANVKTYGAKGDGVTDDTAAIQAAIDALPNGGTVFFPHHDPGAFFRTTSQLTINSQYILFYGASRSVELRFDDGAYTGIKTSVSAAQSGQGFGIRNMTVRGSTNVSPSLLLMDFTNVSPYILIDSANLGFADVLIRLGESYVTKILSNQFNNCNTVLQAVSDGSQADLILSLNTFGTMIDSPDPVLDIQFSGVIFDTNYFETQRRGKPTLVVRTGTQHLIFNNNLFKVENGQAMIIEPSNVVVGTGNIFIFCYDETTRDMFEVQGGSTLTLTGGLIDGRPFGDDTDDINGITGTGRLLLTGVAVQRCAGTAVSTIDVNATGCDFANNGVALAVGSNLAAESLAVANRFFTNGTDMTVGNGDHIIALNHAETIIESGDAGYFGNSPRRALLGELYGAGGFNPPNLVDGAVSPTQTINVSRAVLGDFVAHVSFDQDLQGVKLNAWVSGDNTVSYTFENNTGGTVDLDAGTIRCIVRKGT